MINKILKWTPGFFFFISLAAYSQTTEPSKHPLLDKYYPQPKNDNQPKASTTTVPTATYKEPAANATVTPVAPPTTPAASETPLTSPEPVPTVSTTAPAIAPATTLNKPAPIAPPAAVKKAAGQPGPSLYSETRLGSSTKQYDTWEKNKNGAGSVTTSNK